ncbi:MAG TPA: hypothetical protein VFV34_12430, partial [Blastocatellia bacterium]|nr:hypothetical protein [Blastocatellia bacterium]
GKPVPNLTVEFEFITAGFLNATFPQYPGLAGQLTPAINEPRTGVALQRLPGSGALGSVTTGPDGRAALAITANTPQPLPSRRQFVDSQVYFIGGSWQAAGYLWWANNFAPLSVLVWDSYQIPEAPTWGTDVQPVMVEYMRMYPGMRNILDLTDYSVVSQNAQALKQVFIAPINDPTHMPVTRDLSPAKTRMILNWIANGLPQ